MSPTHDSLPRHRVAQINARNERITRRAEAAANVLVALAIAGGVVLALLAWATPCAEGTLCMGAATQMRPGWLQRCLLRAHAAYLRVLIRAAQADLEYQATQERIAQWEVDQLPSIRKATRLHIEALEIRLIDCELAQRAR